MRIIMAYPHPSTEKGISIYSKNLIEALKKQNVKVEENHFSSGKALSLFKKIKKLSKYDIIHIQHEYNLLGGYGLPYFLLFGILKLFKNKKIVTMHTVLSQEEKFKGKRVKTVLRKILYQLQNRWLGITCDKIIVHAESFKKILVKEYNIASKKIIVLPHAIIEDIPTIDKAEAKKELGLKGNVYLLIGTMIPDHGHDIITRQANKIGKTILIATNPAAVNDRNENKIKNFLELNKKIVKDSNFENNVRFDLGFISDEKWWKYFSAADLVLLPYKGGIGSGIFADAMAAKRPVIASNVTYFKEFAANYDALKLAKNDSEFPTIIKDSMKKKNYEKMIKGCEKFFSENGLTPISKKYKKLYNSLK